MEREPAVAGRFYPSDPGELALEVASFLAVRPGERDAPGPYPALGVLSPHAGYVYSGAVAGATFARVEIPERVVILCPNHTGAGLRVAVWVGDSTLRQQGLRGLVQRAFPVPFLTRFPVDARREFCSLASRCLLIQLITCRIVRSAVVLS